ncbi:MAG: hypothetical protein QM811_15155 [Pirellulales bacterium]
MTDSSGAIRIPAGEHAAIRLLEIGSHDERLALCPIVPGALSKTTLRLPIPAEWLTIQNVLERRRDELLELQAWKLVLQARIAEAEAKRDTVSVERQRAALKLLPDPATFLAEMPKAKVAVAPTVEVAEEGADVEIETANEDVAALEKRQTQAISELRTAAARVLATPAPKPLPAKADPAAPR